MLAKSTNKGSMHEKVKNFGSFINDFLSTNFEDNEYISSIKTSIETTTKDDTAYHNFQFGYLAVLCNQDKYRGVITTIRSLHESEDLMNSSISNLREKLAIIKKVTEELDQVPDDTLREFISKFSRYALLFTRMYFQKEEEIK